MGLDSVELVMAVENEFDIDIRDEDAAHLATVGDMAALIVRALLEKAALGGARPPSETSVLETLRDIIVESTGVSRDKLTREARFGPDLGIN